MSFVLLKMNFIESMSSTENKIPHKWFKHADEKQNTEGAEWYHVKKNLRKFHQIPLDSSRRF